ncbi:hypothetical protein [Clostridium botulinum]|uniref:hypothetical protein n=1 Tax=Clostridium botulinum TaxID=1491 RepID=UPI001E6182CC|nr:hypothetical protein [Clostridium botulinum]MCD3276708.1 hypothetical protein [Clostridium botulinum C/D]MCD3288267.1 hypothetical protein [Clostridium botulinum C/D]MCD3290816.1 hypothetical protein [Clostridium botulinum C/D]MCD3303800.1 hypothetical protein [Clostridium botulinum C/D]
MTDIKKFNPLNVSSKFAICGLPIRIDSYKTCSFGCKYCFSNNRKIMEFNKELQVGNIKSVERKLHKIFDKNEVDKSNFLDMLIKNDITWHWGGMSDPFQPIEQNLHITKQLIDITNRYNRSILFSTKSDNLHGCNINPNLHSFQFSVTNVDDCRDVEPNVPSIEKRYELYRYLKKQGFKVGIRVQPFIPNITNENIVDMFRDADYFTIEGLKLVPQNKEHKEYLLNLLNLNREDFTQMGLLNLKTEIRLKLYDKFIKKLKKYNIPYSIADNDLHDLTCSKCCCGEILTNKTTNFNNTALINKYGSNYTINNVRKELQEYSQCKVNHLFTSNRQEGCKTIGEFYDKRFERKTSPFSNKFLYINKLKDTSI